MHRLLFPLPSRRPFAAPGRSRRQAGATLVVSLLFLLLLTIVGVTSMSTSTLQEKMAGNLRDQDMALQATESALRAGELTLRTIAEAEKPVADNVGTSKVWLLGSTDVLTDTWWNTNSLEYGIVNTKEIEKAYADPRYLIEEHEFVEDSAATPTSYGAKPGMQYYRITARGVGTTGMSQAAIESMYRIRYK